MLSLLFLAFGGLAIWTGVTLFKKGPKEEEIKDVLKDMSSTSISLLNVLIVLGSNIKSLLTLLKESSPQINSNKDGTSESKETKLIPLERSERKKAA